MRLKVELFSTFQRKVRRRTAHQCHTRPRQGAHASALPRPRAKQPVDPANVLPAALCQGVFEVSAVWCVSALIIIIIRSICMALFMDHKDASESKHVNRYDDMVGRCCSREPCDTRSITLIS